MRRMRVIYDRGVCIAPQGPPCNIRLLVISDSPVGHQGAVFFFFFFSLATLWGLQRGSSIFSSNVCTPNLSVSMHAGRPNQPTRVPSALRAVCDSEQADLTYMCVLVLYAGTASRTDEVSTHYASAMACLDTKSAQHAWRVRYTQTSCRLWGDKILLLDFR